MTLPSTNIGSNTINTEVTYFPGRLIIYGTPTRMPHILERDPPNTIAFFNLKDKKAAYKTRVSGYPKAINEFNSTPIIRVSDLFTYITDDDWFSVDVAFHQNALIPFEVWRVFFKYGGDPPDQSDKYADGTNPGYYTTQNGFQEYVWAASTDPRNFDFHVKYNSASRDFWAYATAAPYGDYYDTGVTVTLRRLQYWPEGTQSSDQLFPVAPAQVVGDTYDDLATAGVDTDVIKLYQRYLNRNPEIAGGVNTTALLNSGQTLAQIEALIQNSAEAQARIDTNTIRRVRVRDTLADYDVLYPGPDDEVPTHVNDTEANWCSSDYGVAPNDPATVADPNELTCPPPPPPPGGCFIGDTLIHMADGSFRKIKNIKIGDLVYNYNKTSFNKVRLIEKGTWSGDLYSPTKNTPFASITHPLYINGSLKSANSKFNYPWLDIKESFNPEKIIQVNNMQVFNLLVSGDNTYIVNGYGTNSIWGDGGAIALYIEQGLLTEHDLGFLDEYYWSEFSVDQDNLAAIEDCQVAITKLNKLFANLHNKWINKYIVKYFIKSTSNKFTSKRYFAVIKFISNIIRSVRCTKT